MYKCIIWDMDGTLVNTYRGIYNAYKFAFEKMNIPFAGDSFVEKVIGAPLKNVFTDVLELSETDAIEAVRYYREYYAQNGVLEIDEYDELKRVLKSLYNRGYILCVGTLKRESFAKVIVDKLGLNELFTVIKGVDEKDVLTKKDIIASCLEIIGCEKREAILIGDSEFDEEGARLAGVDFAAVMYGFGFRNSVPSEKVAVFNSPLEIDEFFV